MQSEEPLIETLPKQMDITIPGRACVDNHQSVDFYELAQDAIIIHDLGDRILYWNQAAELLYGYTAEEAAGKPAHELLSGEENAKLIDVEKTLLENGEWQGELKHRTKDDLIVVVDSQKTLLCDEWGSPQSILLINTDKTEKRQLEAQYLRSQRMEGIGSLAGGIAHDLNNLLAPITLSADILLRNCLDEKSEELLSMIKSSSKRAGSVVNQLLSFARGVQDDEHILLQPKHVLNDMVKIVKETFPTNINVKYNLPNDLWLINGDPTQVHQVLLNLCINARDAMPRGGDLFLEAANISFDHTYVIMSSDVKQGAYVGIKVRDTGEGMTKEIMKDIFTPFYTTKSEGAGTGLGLSTSHGIVHSHGGFISVESKIGEGITFQVYFPADRSRFSQVREKKNTPLPFAKGELILIVDDNPNIRIATQKALGFQRYKVLDAKDGTEALALYVKRENKVKAVITDISMPHLDGVALVRILKKLNPEIKVIVSTGQGEKNKISELNALGIKDFLYKPYTSETLVNTLQQSLGSALH